MDWYFHNHLHLQNLKFRPPYKPYFYNVQQEELLCLPKKLKKKVKNYIKCSLMFNNYSRTKPNFRCFVSVIFVDFYDTM